jgi:ATP-dependent DNA helicase RecQ
LQISGFGKAKVDKYADEILEAVESYCRRYNLESNMAAKADSPKRAHKEKGEEGKRDTKKLSFDLFKDGKTITEIAKERNLTANTIEGHLAWFIGTGEVDVNELIPLPKQDLIKSAIKIHGPSNHKILIKNLPADISYGDIRMVLAAAKTN